MIPIALFFTFILFFAYLSTSTNQSAVFLSSLVTLHRKSFIASTSNFEMFSTSAAYVVYLSQYILIIAYPNRPRVNVIKLSHGRITMLL